MRKIVITGGPCVGKTTTLNLLKESGFHVIDEVPRYIIECENKKKVENPCYEPIVPWTSINEFQKLVIAEQVKRESLIPDNVHTVLLDRCLVDVLGYCNVAGINPPHEIFGLIKKARYDKIIFLEQLNNYEIDNARKESVIMAKRIHNEILNVYKTLGFSVLVVPSFDGKVRERADFVKKKVLIN